MTSKRPPVDLDAITSHVAAPMAEAVQRTAETAPRKHKLPKTLTDMPKVPTEDLVPLSFKVPPLFRKRFRNCAHKADIKKVELLFQALDAWEVKSEIKG